MKAKTERKLGLFETEVMEFCEIFGFNIDRKITTVDNFLHDTTDMIINIKIVMGQSIVYADGIRLVTRNYISNSENIELEKAAYESAFKKLLTSLPGAELVVRSTGEEMKTQYGFTRVRLERHIKLPDFKSVAELKLKLEVME